MLKAFKFRLYPTKAQADKINQNIGCARLVYNLMLDAKTKHYEATKQTLHITPASFKSDKAFLKSVDSLALANAQLNLEQAYRNFFKNPEHFGFPQFKSKKHSRLSYKTNNQKDSIRFDGNRLKLPKIINKNIYSNSTFENCFHIIKQLIFWGQHWIRKFQQP